MTQPDIAQDYIVALKDFPDQTQLSISFSKQGKTEYFGLLKDHNGIQPIDNADFAFEIGSITKVFTGNILAQLVLERKVGIDDPIQPFLPFQMLGDPPIILKHLAQHTSGIQRLPHNFYEQPNYQEENPYACCREEQFAQYFSTLLKLDNVPGEKFQYTNLGMSLLSYIISRFEGKPFPAIVSERFALDANVKSLLGWMENIFNPGDKQTRIRSLNGGTGGFGASLMINPDSDFALVVLSNCYPYHYMEKIVPVNKQVMLGHS